MTYRELYESATRKLDHSEITLGEYGEMTKPLDEEVRTWIPVGERLPKSCGVYIVSRWFSDGEESVILTDANYYDGCGEWYNDNRINWGRELVTDKIVAWMPLPEPYNTESEIKITVERPTKKQEKYAQSIAKELGIDLPQIRTKQTYWSFIKNNEDEFRRRHSYGDFDAEDMYGIDESDFIGHIPGDG